MNTDWRSDLEVWLAPFLAALGHKAQRAMCPAYIAGLIGPGDIPYNRLHHFVSAGVWDSAPLEVALWRHADHLMSGKRSWLIIDDTSLPKKGEHSVGVAPQYASTLGKKANCQTLVSVILTSHEVPLMLSLRLFLPIRYWKLQHGAGSAGVVGPKMAWRHALQPRGYALQMVQPSVSVVGRPSICPGMKPG
ncbi:hypothetical protein CSR02_04620 [Acetobacter pomorum]|uniref:Transposase IS701-like DDE domain-containing protein n=1 Tax=Acetobacter pomorum TaxID=65959 RepID=A0A2G4RDT7_9PROT|nr:transposase [Acetobacter pomorum]PHY94743.1 hypothetical protein CSR02_04620 [Acetobacter pomorum]GBR51744.1 transposase [Acetobacter pomorum DSM 11825]